MYTSVKALIRDNRRYIIKVRRVILDIFFLERGPNMRFEKYPKYTLRKLTIGLTSVIVGTIILTSHNAHAAEENVASIANVETMENVLNNSPNTPVENNQNIETASQQAASNEATINAVDETNLSTDDGIQAATTPTTLPVDPDANQTAEDPLKLDKPSDIKSDQDPTNPIVKEDTNAEGKPNDQLIVSDEKVANPSEYAVYLTFKDKDGKDYTTAYLKNGNYTVELDSTKIDFSTLVLNFYYKSTDTAHETKASLLMRFNSNLKIDSSRLNGDITINSKSDSPYQLVYLASNKYMTYDELTAAGKDLKSVTYAWFRWEEKSKGKVLAPGDVLKWQIPVLYTGKTEGATAVQVTNNYGGKQGRGGWANFKFQELYPEIPVDKPSDVPVVQPGEDVDSPMTFEEAVDPSKLAEWQTLPNNSQVVAYLKFQGLDGKEYVMPYLNGLTPELHLDYDKIDPNSFELVLNYRNTSSTNDVSFISSWNSKDFKVNTDKMAAEPEQVTGSGKKYNLTYKLGVNPYLTFAEFLNKAGSLDRLEGVAIKDKINSRDSIQVKIPLKYVGNGRTRDSFGFYTKYQKVIFDRDPAEIAIDQPTGGRDNNDHDSTNPIVLKNYDQVKDADLSRWFEYAKGKATIYLKFKGKDGKDYVTPYLSGSGRNVTTPDFLIDYSQIDPNSLELVVLYQNGDENHDPYLLVDFNKIYGKTGYQVDPSRHADLKWTAESKLHNDYEFYYYLNDGKERSLAETVADNMTVTDLRGLRLKGKQIEANDLVKFTIPLLYKGDHVDRGGIAMSSYKNGGGILDVRMAKPMYNFDEINMYLYPTVKYADIDENGEIVAKQWIHNEELDKILNDAIKNGDLSWDDLLIWDNYGHLFNGGDDYDPFRTDYTGVYDPSERTIYSTTQTFLNLKEIQRYLSVHGYTVQFAKNTHADDHLEPMQIYAYDNNQLKMLYEENTGDDKGEIGNPDNPTGKKAIRFYFSVIPSIIVNDTITYYAGDPNNPKDANGNFYWDPRNLASHANNVKDKIGSKDINKDSLLKGYYDPGYDSNKGFKVDVYNDLPRLDPYEKLADGSYKLTVTIYEEKDDGSLVEVPKVDLTRPGKYTVIYSRVFYGDERKPVSDYVTAEKRLEADSTGKAGELILNKSRVIVLPRVIPTPDPDNPVDPTTPETPDNPTTNPELPQTETDEEKLTVEDQDKASNQNGKNDQAKDDKVTVDHEKIKLVAKDEEKNAAIRDLATDSNAQKLPETGEKKNPVIWGFILALVSLLTLFGIDLRQKDQSSEN